MNSEFFEEVTEGRDLEVIILNDLKCRRQCNNAMNTANRVLDKPKIRFIVRDKSIILQLYKLLVRPHLEYSVQAWRPHYWKDIDLLEDVQRRSTKLLSSIKDKTYED